MRILHTADWHLGRTLYEVRLLEDQAYVLDRIVDAVATERPDVLVVAGDLFDRAVPPADAVRLLDDTLCRIVLGLGVPVVAIAGNHDGPERIDFGAGLLAAGRLHVRGLPDPACTPVVLEDAYGPVCLHPVPYAEPAAIRAVLGDAAVVCHDTAAGALCRIAHAARPAGTRAVLVAHPFVIGGAESESERPVGPVGGAGAVQAATLAGFDYVALGHLHRPQTIAAPGLIRYAGSPLAYSASEIGHAKSLSLVELGAPGTAPVLREVPLSPRRALRRIEGTLAELLTAPPADARDDYVIVRLTDPGPVFDAMARLRLVWPNVLTVERADPVLPGTAAAARGDHRRQSPEDLFAAFWTDVTGEALDPAGLDALRAALEETATDVALKEMATDVAAVPA
jgi:DNA repair protein SbcD/Mre11